MTALPRLTLPRPARTRSARPRGSVLGVMLLALMAAVAARPTASAAAEHPTPAAVENGQPHNAGAGGTHAAAAEPKLMPEPEAPQILTTVVTLVIFLALVAILSKYAWGPIVSGLKAREDKIRKDIREAEEARLRAERTLKQHQAQLDAAGQQVRDLLAKASADAQQLATSIRMNAQQEAEESKERATKEIEAAKNQALAEIYEQTAVLATTVAEKILRRNLNADDQRDLVRSSLEQLKGANAN
jgi:F-type H+-transporting ATPase subunit b